MHYLTRDQSREIDRRAIEDYGLLSLVLMENAGRGCVDVLCSLGVEGTVAICCGKGNNGGDGLVMARHLELRGLPCKVLLWGEVDDLSTDAQANYRILAKTGVPLVHFTGDFDRAKLDAELRGCGWIVDALLGAGASGDPRPPLDGVIERLNASPARKFAVDLPSGLDCDSGQPGRPTFRADHTCTMLGPKAGFAAAEARQYIGQVHVVDIGAPRSLIQEVLK